MRNLSRLAYLIIGFAPVLSFFLLPQEVGAWGNIRPDAKYVNRTLWSCEGMVSLWWNDTKKRVIYQGTQDVYADRYIWFCAGQSCYDYEFDQRVYLWAITCQREFADKVGPTVTIQSETGKQEIAVGYKTLGCTSSGCYFDTSECYKTNTGTLICEKFDYLNEEWRECSGSGCQLRMGTRDVIKRTAKCVDNRWATSIPVSADSGCREATSPPDIRGVTEWAGSFKMYDRADNFTICEPWKPDCITQVAGSNILIPYDSKSPTITGVTGVCRLPDNRPCSYDTIPPTVTAIYLPGSEVSTSGSVSIIATCKDEEGGSSCVDLKKTITITQNGTGEIIMTDKNGNEWKYIYRVANIDNTPPQNVVLTKPEDAQPGYVPIQIKADDAQPGTPLNYEVSAIATDTYVGTASGSTSWTLRAGETTAATLVLTVAGEYHVTVKISDTAGNISKRSYASPLIIYPGDPNISQTQVTIPGVARDSAYANNQDAYVYRIAIKDAFGNPIPNQPVSTLKHDIAGLSGGKMIPVDVSNASTADDNNAIITTWSGATDDNGVLVFFAKSVAPGVFDERFRVKLTYKNQFTGADVPIDMAIYTRAKNSFKKPFIGSLSLINSTPDAVHTAQQYLLRIGQKSTLTAYQIEDFSDSVKSKDVTQKTGYVGNFVNMTSHPSFFARIDSASDDEISRPNIVLNPHAILKATVGGKVVRYPLTAKDAGVDSTPIEFNRENTVYGTRIIGLAQTQGNGSKSSDFSRISTSAMRGQIRKNATQIISGMRSGEEKNGVKYIEGDITIHGDLSYETLVVKNGNIIIDGDLNTSGKKLGIISLRDDAKKKELGNVYVKPAVKYIAALIYADGGLISTGFKTGSDRVESPYKDSSTRDMALQKQLIIKGSLFTANTLGGATPNVAGKYALPGGSVTTDLNSAVMYDLDYLRRGSEGCDKNENGVCTDANEYPNPLVIIYDALGVKNPPKGFSQSEQ